MEFPLFLAEHFYLISFVGQNIPMKRFYWRNLFAQTARRRSVVRSSASIETFESRVLLHGTSGQESDHDHDHDNEELHGFDAEGNEWHAIPEFQAGADMGDYEAPANAPFPLSETFQLHSLPGADHTIYLDFDGHTTSGTPWNNAFNGGNDFVTPEYDFDNTPGFSDAELEAIQFVWQRVMEDFAPFHVNVTTEEPPVADLINSGGSDTRWGIRVAIGGSNADWLNLGAGGIAYVGSFTDGIDNPTFVFPDNLGNGNEKNVAEATSHEVGHTLGLSHDGDAVNSYYTGHGSGETGWAPIMGVGYGQNLVQWSQGEYSGANQQQDDLSIITGNNGFGYRVDDHGNSNATATEFTYNGLAISSSGIIERNTDVDVFEFVSGKGVINIDIAEFELGPNLDVLAELYDSDGNLVASSNPTNELGASITYDVTKEGFFYLHISGTGKGDPLGTGYTDYGSLGQYTITGLVTLPGDLDDEIGEAVPITSGVTVQGSIGESQDVNMYSFTVNAGDTVQFDVDTFGSPLDSRLRLFNANGTQLYDQDNGNNSGPLPEDHAKDPFFRYKFTTAGTYYVAISHWVNTTYDPLLGTNDYTGNRNDVGTYELTVTTQEVTYGSDLFANLNGNWWVAQSNGTNAFSNSYRGYWDATAGWQDVQVADVDADGDSDIVGRTATGQWWVLRNTGTSFVTEYWGAWATGAWEDVQVADVDGDGNEDIVGRIGGIWWVARSNGTSFTTEYWGGWSTGSWEDVHVADVDGDGNDDIVGRINGIWWVARSNGSSFTNEYWGGWSAGTWEDVQVGDVNGDGLDDIVGRLNGNWWVAVSDGSSFTTDYWGGWVTGAWQDVNVTDVDGDGKDDIVGRLNGNWWVARSDGSGFTNQFWGYWVDLGWQDVNIIDVNADGNADIVGRTSDGTLWVARSNGNNAFTNQLWGSLSGNWQDVMVGSSSGNAAPSTAFVPTQEDDEQASIFG